MRALLAAALLVATPVGAETWAQVHERIWFEPEDGIRSRRYQIDMSSLVERNGWTYGNTRVWLTYVGGRQKATPTSSSRFHCKGQKIVWLSHQLVYTRKPNGEWWNDMQIRDGTRFKFTPPEKLAEDRRVWADMDRTKTAAFDFVCKGA